MCVCAVDSEGNTLLAWTLKTTNLTSKVVFDMQRLLINSGANAFTEDAVIGDNILHLIAANRTVNLWAHSRTGCTCLGNGRHL
jgi:hypothetical protein